MEDFIIQKRRPYSGSALLLLVALGIAVLGIVVYVRSDPTMRDRIAEQGQQIEALEEKLGYERDRNQTLVIRHRELKRGLLLLEKGAEVDLQALAVLRDELKSLQEEAFQLREELGLYQAVLNSPQEAKGLDIQGFHAYPTAAEQQFRYKVVLTHFAKDGKAIKGRMQMSINGRQGEKSGSHVVQDLSISPSPDFSFEFKNFKVFEGYIEVPEGFSPRQAVVRLESPDGGRKLIEKTFEWKISA